MSPKTKAHPLNRFKEYHNYLKEKDSKNFNKSIEDICEKLNITTSTYYRIIKTPEKLSPAEKEAIAIVYHLPVHFIFPEMENT